MFTVTFIIGVLVIIILPVFGGGMPVRALSVIALGLLLFIFNLGPLWAIAAVILLQVFIIIVSLLYYYVVGWLALSGRLGEGRQWISEMVVAGDDEFIKSMNELESMDVKEIIVVSDSKQEFRQRVIDRGSGE